MKRHLRLSVTEGRIPHAQLFTGAAGAGKLPLALAYAQYIACPHRTAGDSCGVCPTCRQFQALQHPDLHFAFPIVKTDSGDTCNDFMAQWRRQLTTQPYFDLDDWYRTLGVETKQGIIYDKESSEILRKLSLKSFADGYKFMLIWLPEKMNASCANKLLKLLEEPPEKTLFLLVSEQPELLLSTIVSRTQEIRVPRLTEGDIAAELTRSRGIGGTEAQDLAHIANGSLTAAYKLADENEQNTLFFNDFVALMRNAWLVGKRKDYSALLSRGWWANARTTARCSVCASGASTWRTPKWDAKGRKPSCSTHSGRCARTTSPTTTAPASTTRPPPSAPSPPSSHPLSTTTM